MTRIENKLRRSVFTVMPPEETPFCQKNDIYQDGTTPMCRDRDGRLWAMSGHTHLGHIGMFCGDNLDTLREVYPIQTNFQTGAAGQAFDCVLYPEGILPRGSVWPFGLFICPATNRFFCFFHNETGWAAKKTGYIITGPGDGEPDFRHIGLMFSDDCGKHWTFSRWIITSNEACYSEKYRPDSISIGGQRVGRTCLGAGDFSIFDDPKSEYLYLFYNLLYVDSQTGLWQNCDVYIARTRKRADGMMGDFVKFNGDAFCEAGNFGRETLIVPDTWHGKVVYFKPLQIYVMSGTRFSPDRNAHDAFSKEQLLLRTSNDLLHWSDPICIPDPYNVLHTHYFTIVPDDKHESSYIITEDFSILSCHNGTDVKRSRVHIFLQ